MSKCCGCPTKPCEHTLDYVHSNTCQYGDHDFLASITNGPGNVSIANNLSIYGTQSSVNYSTGSIVLYGGLSILETTNASSNTCGGSITTAGGLSIAKDLYIGGNIYCNRFNRVFIMSFVKSGLIDTSDFMGYINSSFTNTPAISRWNAKMIGLEFSNQSNISADIIIYKNGTTSNDIICTWSLTNKTYAWQTSNIENITINSGDRIYVYYSKTGTSGTDVVVNIEWERIDDTTSSG